MLPPDRKHCVTELGTPTAARAVVFIHGFGADQTSWSAVAPAFAGDFRVVLFDNAGAGRSAPEAFVQDRYLGLAQYATDLIALADHLMLRNAAIVGHSMGGMIGVLAALRRPDLVSRLVLIGASPRYLDDEGYHGGLTKAALDDLYRCVTLSYAEWADGYATQAMRNSERPELARYFAESLKSIPSDRALTVLCSLFQSDHRSDLAKLDKPTLLVQSRDDIAVPAEVAQFMHRQIRGSRLSVIDASGHFPHVSAPDKVLAAIRPFLYEAP